MDCGVLITNVLSMSPSDDKMHHQSNRVTVGEQKYVSIVVYVLISATLKCKHIYILKLRKCGDA